MSKEKKAGLMNASARDGVNYRKASIWEILFGMSNNGAMIAFYLLVGYASMIATEGYGIAVATAGILLTANRVVDGAVDALIAAIFEKTRLKRGKMRFFMIVGWMIFSVGAMLLYNWAAGKFTGFAGFLVFLLAYNLFLFGYSLNGVSGNAIGIVLTNDPTQRPMLSVVGTAFSYVVPILFTNLTTFVILPKYDNQFTVAMLSEATYWYIVISGIFVAISCFGIRKVDVGETFQSLPGDNGEEEDKVTIKDMWSVLKDNRNVQMYMLAGISDKLAQQTGSQAIITTLMNGVLIGSYAASTMVQNFSTIVGLCFAFGGGIFIAKWGAKKATTTWSWIAIAVAAVSVGFCLLLGGPDGMKKIGVMGAPIIIWAILTIARNGAAMVLTTTASAMKADIVDYEYERSGKYMPAVVTGVYTFIDQLISSFGSTIAGICITLVGYTSSVPQLGDKATWPIFWMGMFLTFGLPIIGWICNVIAMKFYNLDRERMVQVQKTLEERRKAAEEKAEGTKRGV